MSTYHNGKQVVRIVVSEGIVHEITSRTGDFFEQHWRMKCLGSLPGGQYMNQWRPMKIDRELTNKKPRKKVAK